ncbi:hypothetical protein GEU84_003385 [Fertoebacter nigrum]|uniref:Uncharacterized protein n=1 Tax=Fertoeibacter niger TaxID=2656921 RepID=A0A8X8KPW3_9RHOB|nr:hypothetical protein [Fertoeibacter niger]NUB43417.1 hypothetical protein [Fertoeibacter niger]
MIAGVKRAAGLALLAVILIGHAYYWRERANGLAGELAAAEAEVTAYQRSAEVHRAHLKRMEAEAARWAGIEHDLKSLEGRDEPLSDSLRAAAQRLWN